MRTIAIIGITFFLLNSCREQVERGVESIAYSQNCVSNYEEVEFTESETTWHVSAGLIRASGGYGIGLEGSHYVSPKVSFLGGTRIFPSTDRGLIHEVYAGLGLHKNAATIGTGSLAVLLGTMMAVAIGRSQ